MTQYFFLDHKTVAFDFERDPPHTPAAFWEPGSRNARRGPPSYRLTFYQFRIVSIRNSLLT